jgi:hypothetical protein
LKQGTGKKGKAGMHKTHESQHKGNQKAMYLDVNHGAWLSKKIE